MEKQRSPIQLKSEYLVVYENMIALNISCQLVFVMQRKTSHPVQMYINMPEARSVIYLPSNNKEAHHLYQEYTELFVDLYENQGRVALETKLASLRHEVCQGKKIQFDTLNHQETPLDKDA